MHKVLIPLALAAMTFSGCLGGDDATGGTVTFEETTLEGLTLSLTLSNATATVGDALNITLDAALPETMEDARGNGTGNSTGNGTTAPFADATWTLHASPLAANNATADGNATDNGTAPAPLATFEGVGLPAMVSHAFAANGTYLLTAVVEAAGYERSSVTAEVMVIDAMEVVEEVEEVPAIVDDFEPIEWAGSADFPCNQCYTQATMDLCVGFVAGVATVDCDWFEIPPEAAGRAFASTSSGDDADLAFYSSCSSGNQIEFVGQTGHDEGVVPEGAGCIVITDWLMPLSAFTVTIS